MRRRFRSFRRRAEAIAYPDIPAAAVADRVALPPQGWHVEAEVTLEIQHRQFLVRCAAEEQQIEVAGPEAEYLENVATDRSSMLRLNKIVAPGGVPAVLNEKTSPLGAIIVDRKLMGPCDRLNAPF